MIIDQLPILLGDALLTDEFPIERGTTSYKATLEQILGLAFSEIEPNFAGAYDSTATYAVGDYVVYEHNLYICNTDISTAEDWTAAHWTQIDLASALKSLETEIDTKQDKITASGVLKGNGSAVSAATLGTDYGARVFQVTLAAADWSSNAQTVSSTYFYTAGYVYLVEPVQASKDDYGSAEIYADDVSTYGEITFHCTTTPTSDLTVNVCRIVSANNKTINIAGGGSSGGGSWKLLWTNSNDAADFSAQNISIDTSGCTEIQIYWKQIKNDTYYFTHTDRIGYGRGSYLFNQSGGKIIRRGFTITDASTIHFEDGQVYNSYGTAATSNERAIPAEIYAR